MIPVGGDFSGLSTGEYDMSTLTDLKRCFATFANLFSSVSTQGVGVNQITAVDCGADM